jgi:hypothetical protein
VSASEKPQLTSRDRDLGKSFFPPEETEPNFSFGFPGIDAPSGELLGEHFSAFPNSIFQPRRFQRNLEVAVLVFPNRNLGTTTIPNPNQGKPDVIFFV